jgi:hypothetical protein
MKAAKLKKNLYYRSKLAFDAGVDMVMLPWNTRGQVIVHGRIKSEVVRNANRRELYVKKVNRILKLKEKYNVILKGPLPSVQVIAEQSEPYLTKLTKKLFSKIGFYSLHKSYILSNHLKNSKQAIIITNYKTTAQQLKLNNKHRKTVFYHSSYLEDKNFIKKIMEKHKDSPIYFQVSNKKTLELLKNIKKDLRGKIFLLISNDIRSNIQDQFSYQIKTYTHLPIIGRLIGEHLSTSKPSTISKYP